ncbi:MAG: Clp1/GlmU family protein [Gammaproteobacteria bacterium]|nr:Clp1/GlmU family protein [Gammaproteobacteria bacterium]
MHAAIACSPKLITGDFLTTDRRVLLIGESGIGKSTLAAALARTLAQTGRACSCIGADPGSPAFGVPGAVCLGKWQKDAWQLVDIEPLCTLDGGRFRLPLVSAVRYLAQGIYQAMVLVDAPGVVRSIAGAELLLGLVEAAAIDTVLVLCRDDKKLPLANELATLACEVVFVQAPSEARPPSPRKRTRQRTRLWDEYLHHGVEKTFTFSETQLTGTPPPLNAEQHWQGRQIALLKCGRTIAMGEVLKAAKNIFQVRIGDTREIPDQILTRNSYRNRQGYLATVKPVGPLALHYIPPPDVAPYPGIGQSTGPRPVARIGEATATLVNGIFGDPLLHLRLHNRKRSILFDLGEGGRLPARLAHQVTEVFISHAHIDHISGFLWLMRSRIGAFPSCRLFGPPGLADHIAGLISGIHWDRIGGWGPRFTVGELHADRLIVYGLQAGKESREQLDERPAPNGLLVDEPALRVWAVTLHHGGIPVLAYGLEQAPKLNIQKKRLLAHNLTPGPWLRELKQRIAGGDRETVIQLPDSTSCNAADLADELLQITPAQKLVYATDIADVEANREKLTVLARGAHTFFCEAAFIEADTGVAERSGHLTSRACGEIAQAAGVERLVPFHFSRRYEDNPLQVYNEVKWSCGQVVLPKSTDFIPG